MDSNTNTNAIPWDQLDDYAYIWDANYEFNNEVSNVDFDGEYHFVYPLKSITQELQDFPELKEITMNKLVQLGTDISKLIAKLAKKKKLIDKVPDLYYRKMALTFFTTLYGTRIEKLRHEYKKFENIGKVILGDKKALQFDAMLSMAKEYNIIDTVEKFTKVKKMGPRYLCNCLFHNEKTPSMVLYPDSQSFHCFGCHKSGDSIDVIMYKNGVSLREAVAILTN